MMKWTASAQKLNIDSPIALPQRTPRRCEIGQQRRRLRRATIANKENIPYATSTPVVPTMRAARNSPLVLAPLVDILNITPEISSPSMLSIPSIPERSRNNEDQDKTIRPKELKAQLSSRSRRHSTIGITLPSAVPLYARTLPRFQDEEYSPSTVLPTGQQLALRGLLPDPFLANARYFQTPAKEKTLTPTAPKSQMKKRNLVAELVTEDTAKHQNDSKSMFSDITGISSSKMGNETLDKLIDAILDSARKDTKKKKTRKSFNLRRRTLLKSHAEGVEDVVLSPSYAAGDDPASDLSFLLVEPPAGGGVAADNDDASKIKHKSPDLVPSDITIVPTPAPVTPPPGTPLPQSVLCQLPTPTPTPALNVSTTTFKLETPIRTHTRKRRQTHRIDTDTAEQANRSKKFKVDSRNYFELGVALPSIYV